MDVVIFEVHDSAFAFPAQTVVEVRDPMFVTPLPFAPHFVDGLINVSDRVITQMDAARCLGMVQGVPASEGSVLVCEVAGTAVGIHVGRVLAKTSIDDSQISWCGTAEVAEPAHNDIDDEAAWAELALPDESEEDRHILSMSGIDAQCVQGEFVWGERSVLLLQQTMFGLDRVESVREDQEETGLLGSALSLQDHAQAQQEVNDRSFICLLVQANNELYALRLNVVQEVVERIKCTPLPHATPEVAGMLPLRNSSILGLSLNVMLGGALFSGKQVVVVVQCANHPFALLVEKVIGIQNFTEDGLQAAEQGREMEGFLVGADQRMIGLLDLNSLIPVNRYQKYLVDAHLHQVEVKVQLKRRLLSFELAGEQCALPLECVQRVDEFSEFTLLPDSDQTNQLGFSGVVQIHGAVVPVINLREAMRMAEPGAEIARTAQFVVVQLAGELFALVVDRVERVVEIEEDLIEPVRMSGGNAMGGSFIDAVGRLNGRLISILTLDPLKQVA